MTTKAQVKKAVKPLLERNLDLGFEGRLVFVKPIRHFVKGVFIDRTGSAGQFRPLWVAIMLFERLDVLGLSWCRDIFPREKGLWDLARPNITEAMCERIEEIALPIARSIDTLGDFKKVIKEHFPDRHVDLFVFKKIIFDAAMGDLEAARATIAQQKARIAIGYQPIRREAAVVDELFEPILAGDRTEIARVLHAWEEDRVLNAKLEAFWQPTPFPIELG